MSTSRLAGSASFRAALRKTLRSLEQHKYANAALDFRDLVKKHRVPSSVFVDAQQGIQGQPPDRMALSIATVGARLSLVTHQLESASGFVKFLREQDDTPDQVNDTLYDIALGLMDLETQESLSHATTMLLSIPPDNIPPFLVKRFYEASSHHPALVTKIWSHCRNHDLPSPKHRALAALLSYLVQHKQYSEVISIISSQLKHIDPETKQLPPSIPLDIAPEVLTYAIRAGATAQALQLWEIAEAQVGEITRPPSPDQKLFLGSPQMTHAFVRHFTNLAAKKPYELNGWHRAQLQGNPDLFHQTARRIFSAYAAVHGFDQLGAGYMQADHYHITTAIACLFELGQFTDALEALETFFKRNEAPDAHDFGIILASLARRHSGRAVQILLEAAPARIPGFKPNAHHYSIVLHQSLIQGKLAEAWRVLEHAQKAGCGSIDPSVLDMFVRHSLEDIRLSWMSSGPGRKEPVDEDTRKRMNAARLATFHQIKIAFEILGQKANVSTVRVAIERAISIRRPLLAWDIRMWAQSTGLLGRVHQNDKERQQWDRGKASAWKIARSLWSSYQREQLSEAEMWFKIRAIGVPLPREVEKQGAFWREAFEKEGELEDLALQAPVSLRRRPASQTEAASPPG